MQNINFTIKRINLAVFGATQDIEPSVCYTLSSVTLHDAYYMKHYKILRYCNSPHMLCLLFIVPWKRTKFGNRAFSVAGPTVWNSLPESVRSAGTLALVLSAS